MTDEEYEKLVREREEYKKRMNQRQQEINRTRYESYNNYMKNTVRMVNPDKTDAELERYQNFGNDKMYEFYTNETEHLDGFFERLKKKIFNRK